MKKISTILLTVGLTLITSGVSSQICDINGNIIIFSNYDGGTLNINVDLDIPNLKIGVVSYEAVEINISGTYASNVTEVNYSGYNQSPNTNCSPTIATTVINGAGSATTAIDFAPAVSYTDPDGYGAIICAYDCSTGYQGGCNTVYQIAHFYQDLFGGSVFAHQTQYGCWSGTQNVSTMGNCCLGPPSPPVADFSASANDICINECVDFTNLSTGGTPDTWTWTAVGATPPSSTDINPTFCFPAPGVYNVELELTNMSGTDVFSLPITVSEVETGVTVTGFTMTSDAVGATYQWLDCDNSFAPITGETSASYTPSSDGNYAVSVTANGCTDTSACSTISGIGFEENTLPTFTISPNPTNGEFLISGLVTGSEISIYTLDGKLVIAPIVASSNSSTINLKGHEAGVYFVEVKTNHGKNSVRLVLQ